VGFERTISASTRPQTYALDRAATGIGLLMFLLSVFMATFEGRAGGGLKFTSYVVYFMTVSVRQS
jgi:hypothetical protein